jgi:hypothetical protein
MKKQKQQVMLKADILNFLMEIIGISKSKPSTEYNKARKVNNNTNLFLTINRKHTGMRSLLERIRVTVRYMRFEIEALNREKNKALQEVVYLKQILNDLEEDNNEADR